MYNSSSQQYESAPPPPYQAVDTTQVTLNNVGRVNSLQTQQYNANYYTTSEDRMQLFQQLVGRYEINREFATKLRGLEGYEIVFICDDSGSMNTPLGDITGPFDRLPTRWDELKQTVSIVVDIASVLDPDGVDIYFLNREPMFHVKHSSELIPTFAVPPQGPTPIVSVLRQVLADKKAEVQERKLLILLATDGVPTDMDGKRDTRSLEQLLRYGRNPINRIPVTFIACTDDDECIGYLNKWDKNIEYVDVVDDYRNEKKEIQNVQGRDFPFSFGDYVVKILMGSVDPWFDDLDEKKDIIPAQQQHGGFNSVGHQYPNYQPTTVDDRMSKFQDIVNRYEINREFATRLRNLEGYEVVFIVDDSGSMNTPLGDITSPFDRKPSRWDELKQTVSIVVDIASVLDPDGVDIYFLNREPQFHVKHSSELVPTFAVPPAGLTPIVPVLRKVLYDKQAEIQERKLLILLATDGAPTDESGHQDVKMLEHVLRHERNPINRIPVTFIACTDDDDCIGYLNKWDKNIPYVDVIDDYKNERQEIHNTQGRNFPFSFGDYVVKILMGSVDSWFDGLDERRVNISGPVTSDQHGKKSKKKGCTII
ncbi:unnamed protein product [Didymodactylos carnosus]|uniref:VWFA domain-containing protein n=1 Tax=Didymodactylos carnosus TaxID=1234261 RepID=A0A813X7Q3_9BILA|nr:unnamed protein product [Didymodactylos carnosus]CAF0867634.1 unnamed protein product [Didymodactylos carnosus]CAF3542413.1 unnamed protein product [Didymodactylos carnosus]CAF3655083.1 unnamed protein product [Didymodactylos carnosus]